MDGSVVFCCYASHIAAADNGVIIDGTAGDVCSALIDSCNTSHVIVG